MDSDDSVLDFGFLTTKEGILKMIQVVIAICAIICTESSWCVTTSQHGFALFTIIFSLIFSVIFLIICVTRCNSNLADKFNVFIPIAIIDVLLAVFYLIFAIIYFSSNVCLVHSSANVAAGVFGIIGTVVGGLCVLWAVVEAQRYVHGQHQWIYRI